MSTIENIGKALAASAKTLKQKIDCMTFPMIENRYDNEIRNTNNRMDRLERQYRRSCWHNTRRRR